VRVKNNRPHWGAKQPNAPTFAGTLNCANLDRIKRFERIRFPNLERQ